MEVHVPREKQPITLIIAIPSPRIGYITLHRKPLSVVQLCETTKDHFWFGRTACASWSLGRQYLFLSLGPSWNSHSLTYCLLWQDKGSSGGLLLCY